MKRKVEMPIKNTKSDCNHEWISCEDNFGSRWTQCKICNAKKDIINPPKKTPGKTDGAALTWFFVGFFSGFIMSVCYFVLVLNDICINL